MIRSKHTENVPNEEKALSEALSLIVSCRKKTNVLLNEKERLKKTQQIKLKKLVTLLKDMHHKQVFEGTYLSQESEDSSTSCHSEYIRTVNLNDLSSINFLFQPILEEPSSSFRSPNTNHLSKAIKVGKTSPHQSKALIVEKNSPYQEISALPKYFPKEDTNRNYPISSKNLLSSAHDLIPPTLDEPTPLECKTLKKTANLSHSVPKIILPQISEEEIISHGSYSPNKENISLNNNIIDVKDQKESSASRRTPSKRKKTPSPKFLIFKETFRKNSKPLHNRVNRRRTLPGNGTKRLGTNFFNQSVEKDPNMEIEDYGNENIFKLSEECFNSSVDALMESLAGTFNNPPKRCSPKMKLLQCDRCDFSTSKLGAFKRHELVH